MEFNTEVRRKQLENLDQFISSSKDRVESILDYLGWTKEKINETHKEMSNCIFDPHHRIPASTAAAHVQKCSFRKEGYDKNEKFLSDPNPVPGSTILIDDTTKIKILTEALSKNPTMKTGWRTGEPVPRTSDRLLSVFTNDERTALYDYTIASTSGPPQVPEFNIMESKKEEKNLTDRDIAALERDSRRRRIKYKAKCVHSSRKNTTEIMREVINGQMEAYEDWLRHELNLETSSTSTSRNRDPSPHSSSKHSYEDERRHEQKNKYRSRSKDSDLKCREISQERKKYKYRERSHERERSRNREKSDDRKRFKYREISNDRERSGNNHRSRSSSRSKKYEKHHNDKHDKYYHRYKYDNYEKYRRRDEKEKYRTNRSKDRYYNERYLEKKRCGSFKYD